MNIRGRLIEEMEQIPNVISLISSIPKISGSLQLINKRIDLLEDRIINMDKRIYSNIEKSDGYENKLTFLSDEVELIKNANLA